MNPTLSVGVILLAGGSSSRMHSAIPKPFMKLGNQRVIDFSLEVFQSISSILEICVVCPEAYRSSLPAELTFASPGNKRQDSVYSGLCAFKQKPAFVLVHDAARPLIQKEVVEKIIEAMMETKAAIAAVPVTSTVKLAHADQTIDQTLDRSRLWEAQTPQGFAYELLLDAFHAPINQNYEATDDACLVERLGISVTLVLSSYKNIKITQPEDILIATHLLT